MTNTTEAQPILSLPTEVDFDTMVEIPLGLLMLLSEGIIAIKHGIVGEEALADWAFKFAMGFTSQFPIPDDDLTPPHGTPRP